VLELERFWKKLSYVLEDWLDSRSAKCLKKPIF
jgi:hypothetical protein